MTYITQSTSKESGVGSRILVMAFVVLGIMAMQSRPVHAQWTTNGNNINNTNSGNVGIGTTTPGALLHGKRDQNTNTTVVIENADIGTAAYSSLEVRSGTTYADSIRVQAMGSSWPSNGAFAQDSGVITASANLSNGLSIMTQANAPIRFYTNGQAYERMRIDPSGNVGIGTAAPTAKLHILAPDETVAPALSVRQGSNALYGFDITLDNNVNGNLSVNRVNNGTAANLITLDRAGGNVGIGTANPTEALEVIGSIKVSGNINAKYQDLAEWVESSQALAAGTVVVLDHTRSNQVIASSQAYDTRVAGVISLQPGITLGEPGAGKVLVATTGRVKIKVDATLGPIQIGDLLVTGDREGVAKKSEPLNLGGVQIHRPGTLIGKALEPLAKGSGSILVLLSLQ